MAPVTFATAAHTKQQQDCCNQPDDRSKSRTSSRELGPESASLHREVGRRIAALPVSRLITFGQMTRELTRGAQDAGMRASVCRHAESHQQIVDWLKNEVVKDAWILVKGSRSMAMDRVVEGILAG